MLEETARRRGKMSFYIGLLFQFRSGFFVGEMMSFIQTFGIGFEKISRLSNTFQFELFNRLTVVLDLRQTRRKILREMIKCIIEGLNG